MAPLAGGAARSVVHEHHNKLPEHLSRMESTPWRVPGTCLPRTQCSPLRAGPLLTGCYPRVLPMYMLRTAHNTQFQSLPWHDRLVCEVGGEEPYGKRKHRSRRRHHRDEIQDRKRRQALRVSQSIIARRWQVDPSRTPVRPALPCPVHGWAGLSNPCPLHLSLSPSPSPRGILPSMTGRGVHSSRFASRTQRRVREQTEGIPRA